MKYVLTIIVLLSCVISGSSQVNSRSNQNALSFELGKTGLIYNLVFDHRLKQNKLGFRLGAGSNLAQYLNAVTVGGGGYYLAGKKKRFLELGLDLQYYIVDKVSDDQKGFSFVYPDYSIKTIFFSLNAGYRSYGKKTMFRVGLSPGLIDNKFIPGGYISYGFTF